MSRLDPATWLPQAKALAVGQTKKVRHTCGKREAMTVGNEQGHYWAFCFRCGCGGRHDKASASIGQPKPKVQTGRVPTDVRSLTVSDLVGHKGLAECLDRHSLVRYLTLLRISPSTGRLYLPDAGKFWYGLDYTGAANARWYSPLKVQACIGLLSGGPVQVVQMASDYMNNYRDRVLMSDKASTQTINAVLCVLLKAGVRQVQCRPELKQHFKVLEE